MRGIVLTTAAVAAAIGLAVAGEPNGTFTDKRDGQTYLTVTIGKQTWMAQNLNYKMDSSWCYENKSTYCKKYGRLYTWDAAMTACPDGYHLPSRQEWDSLVKAVGSKDVAGKMLKSKNGWNDYYGKSGNGTDDFRFSALPGGHRSSGGNFYNAGYGGYWWTATEGGDNYAYSRYMNYNYDYVNNYYGYKSGGYSVRCVADTP